MTLPHLVLAILASYLLAYMVVVERGPFNLFLWIRSKVANRWAESWVDKGLNCLYCTSFWTSLLVALLVPWAGWQLLLLYWWGVAGAAWLLVDWVHGGRNA